MNYNEEMDKIVLDKLGGYSEEPAPDVFRSILSERERSAKSKLLNRILLIAVGIAALAALMYLLLRNDKADGQTSVFYPDQDLTASSADNFRNSSSFSRSGNPDAANGPTNLYNQPALATSSAGSNQHPSVKGFKNVTYKNGADKKLPTPVTSGNQNKQLVGAETAPQTQLSVAFNYLMDSLGEITFYNQTISSEEVEYEWYFGDGTATKEKDPRHKFNRNGFYHVCLTATTASGTYDSHCDDISIDHLPNRKNLIGKVNAGNSVPDKGWVYLISFDSVSRVPYLVDSSKLDEMGYFAFNEIPTGFYIVRATLEQKSIHFREFMPTYYGQTLVWNIANRYNLSAGNRPTSDLLIINLLQTRGKNNGNNSIDGQTNTGDNLLDDNIVILYDNQGKPIGYAHLDPDGRFSFGDLPPGSYQVYNPKTGSYTTYTTSGTTTSTTTTTAPPQGGTSGTTTQSGSMPPPPQPEVILYPNPCTVSDVLTVKFNNSALLPYTITVIDQSNGATKFTQKGDKYLVSVQQVQIDVSYFPSRVYQVIVTLGNKTLPSAQFTR